MLADRMNGMLPEEEWSDVVNYLYNSADSQVLNAMLRDIASGGSGVDAEAQEEIAASTQTSSHGHAPAAAAVKARLGGSGSGGMSVTSLGRSAAATLSSKEQKEAEMKKYGYLRSNLKIKKPNQKKLMIVYSDFVHCILDFQLKNHEKFLSRFVSAFRQVDVNLDGVINPEEFHDLFLDIRFDGMKVGHVPPEQRAEAEETFSTLLNVVDPYQHNRISFSAAASCLSRLGAGAGGGRKKV